MSHTLWTARKIRDFQRRLLAWYDSGKRDLPWRRNPDPYRVWISEVMLQQTQVRTMLPYYRRFIERFPDPRSLAAGSEEEILSLWSGLGYYSRARNLRFAARRIMEEYGGEVPDSMEHLLKLPGIGRYTAGAIHSIAHNSPQPVVDGNVKRVLARLDALKSRVAESYYWAHAEAWVSRTRPSDFNQAVMELGALICTKSKPQCLRCPVVRFCLAHGEGIEDLVPVSRSGRAAENISLVILVAEGAGRVLVSESSPIRFIPGPCSLPLRILAGRESAGQAAQELAAAVLGHPVRLIRGARVRHAITFRRLTAHIYRLGLSAPGGLPEVSAGFRWIARSEARRFLTSGLYHKALDRDAKAA